MKTLRIISFLVLFTLFCNEKKTTDFQKFCAEIPVLQLPFFADCNNLNNIPELSFSSPLDNRRPAAYLIGRVFSDLQFFSLIYIYVADANFPSIFTFTLDGKPIDTLMVVGLCFSNAYGVTQTFSARIDQNKTISIIDTVKSYELNSQENEIPNSETILIRTNQYQLIDAGEFILISKDEIKLY